jgi:hypothetical protein
LLEYCSEKIRASLYVFLFCSIISFEEFSDEFIITIISASFVGSLQSTSDFKAEIKSGSLKTGITIIKNRFSEGFTFIKVSLL